MPDDGLTFGAVPLQTADDGLDFGGHPQPPTVPPDPTGEDWRGPPGEPGPVGPQGPTGPSGALTDLASPPPIGNVMPNSGAFTSLATSGTVAFGGTGSVKLPVGTVAQRDSVALGKMRFNSTNNQPEMSRADRYVPIADRTVRATTLAALKAWDITGFLASGERIQAFIDSHQGGAGIGAGAYDWNGAATFTPDDVLVVRPNSISGSNPGRWMRRLEGNVIPGEAAGMVGDYVFPTAGVGEILGTDNAAAFTAAAFAASTSGVSKQGGTIQLGSGRFRIAAAIVAPPGIKVVGVGGSSTGSPGDPRFDAGTCLVLDGAAALLAFQDGFLFDNIKIMRRGMDKNPTSGQVDAYWTARVSELAGGFPWLPGVPVSAGDVRVNLNNVYYYDTTGTTGVTNTGGPIEQIATVGGITDGTATCHFLNEYQWSAAKPYVAGTLVANLRHVYRCDTSGTSASSGGGPTGTSTGINSITDGTAKWHWVASYQVAVRPSTFGAITNSSIIGFARGLETKDGIRLDNVIIDCINGIDIQEAGDAMVWDGVKARAIYNVAGANPRRHGIAFNAHDRVDGLQMRSCGAQLWARGARFSNMWPWCVDSYFESAATTRGDSCIEIQNCVMGGIFRGNYGLGMIAFNIEATTDARSPSPPSAGVVNAGLTISGGWWGVYFSGGAVDAKWTPTHFRFNGATFGIISDVLINGQGRQPFRFYPVASPGNDVNWLIDGVMIEEAAVSDFNLDDLAVIDSSVAELVHFTNCRHRNTNRLIVPPGHDSTLDLVAAPANGGARTIPNGMSACRLNHAATIAGFTVTYPSEPLDGQRLSVTSRSIVTALTQNGGSGNTIEAAETTIDAGGIIRRRYIKSIATWVKD